MLRLITYIRVNSLMQPSDLVNVRVILVNVRYIKRKIQVSKACFDGFTVLREVFYLRRCACQGLGCKRTAAPRPPEPAVQSLPRCYPCVPPGGLGTGTVAAHLAAVPPRGQLPSSADLWGTDLPAPGPECSFFASPVPWRKCGQEVLGQPAENSKYRVFSIIRIR